MKSAFAVAVALLAAPVAAAQTESLPGVEDQETTIPYGQIQQFERGHGDVLFVRDRTDQWYRLGLNKGCLSGPVHLDRLAFRSSSTGNRIDLFTKIDIPRELRSCSIVSIRRSAPPPQVDSKSPVTLD